MNQYSSASVLISFRLIKPGTRCFLMRKNVSAIGTCSGLVALARTCMSHNATPQEKVPHQLLLAYHLLE